MWSKLNVPGAYAPCSLSLFGSAVGCYPFHCMQKKESCMLLVTKVEIYFPKIVFGDSKWPNLIISGSYTIHFWGPVLGFPLSACRLREMLHGM